MVEFQIKKLIPQVEGTASTIKFHDVKDIYADAVEKFVRDNSGMGEQWQERVLDLLCAPIKTPAKDGDLRGSNSYMNTFLAQIGIPLIELQDSRRAYDQNNHRTPFSDFYVETGLALISLGKSFERNSRLADKLNCDFKKRNIKIGKGKVPNFTQLVLLPDLENGLTFGLNENSNLENIPNLEEYKWAYQGENGLFRAFLNCSSYWYAGYDNLEYSNEYGRVVRYDAEGVAPEKTESSKDFIQKRLNRFRNIC